MNTYLPKEYAPFKKRIKGAFIGTLVLFLIMSSYRIAEALTTNNEAVHSNSMSREDQILTALFLGGMILFLIGIIIYSQIWVLDEVIIDPKRKKLKILIRKFDTIIDKGEFDIDDNLKVKVQTKKGHGKTPITAMGIKYGKKIIFTQSNSNFAGAPSWPGITFFNIRDEVEHIQKTNFSSLSYKG